MESVPVDFSRGVVAVAELYEAEVARLDAAGAAIRAYLDSGRRDRAESDRLNDDLRAERPLWWRISGVHFWLGEDGLEARRLGLNKLIAAVEAMYRGELKNSKFKNQNSKGGIDGGLCSVGTGGLGDRAGDPSPRAAPFQYYKKGRAASALSPRGEGSRSEWTGNPPAFYDPLREMCHFLQIPLSKLSQLCLEYTGLRAHELGDVIRAEGFRLKLTEKLRPLAAQWWDSLSEKESAKLSSDTTEVAGRFLKWVRGRGRAGNRKKWAWELGIPTAARLSKAVFQETGLTLEELELDVGVELVEGLLGVSPVQDVALEEGEAVEVVSGAQSAGLDDVGTLCEKVDETRGAECLGVEAA